MTKFRIYTGKAHYAEWPKVADAVIKTAFPDRCPDPGSGLVGLSTGAMKPRIAVRLPLLYNLLYLESNTY